MSEINDASKIVFLTSSKEWKHWYGFIVQEASQAGVLDFINLDKPDRITDMKMPEKPRRQPEEAKSKWIQMGIHRTEVSKINSLIWRTVSSDEMKKCTSGAGADVKDILKALRKHLSPTIESRQYEIRERQKALCKPPKIKILENDWMKWVIVEQDLRDAGIIDSCNLKTDFINANMTIDSGLAQAYSMGY
ncbi:hypothetical protein ACJ72_02188 [Emergomyces africanus]|uniref:Uncharacterized protein n=1 Tax=Emergomyces africanus TaxID=1955775 RepID=A0A1B7P350_9EURO|nr:hypothetical protein ACJ72_02188 [Emergomyces africanus]